MVDDVDKKILHYYHTTVSKTKTTTSETKIGTDPDLNNQVAANWWTAGSNVRILSIADPSQQETSTTNN